MTPSKKKAGLPDTPIQDDETRTRILQNSAAGGDTAVGNERKRQIAEAEGEEFDGPGGSELEIAGGDPQPDHPPHEAPSPVGAQAQPSNFTTNGSLPVNMVASPSGLVPVSAVTADPAQGATLIQENLDITSKAVLKSGSEKLSRAKIESMSAGDLRAVAHDRGYDVGEQSGSRTTRKKFIQAQQDDDDAADDAGDEASHAADPAATTGA